jgi:hypothetical protein
MDRNGLLVEPCNLGVPSHVSKMIFGPMVRLTQTVHLSCTDTNTVSKWTETRFHRTHITEELYRVRPHRFFEPMVLSPETMHISCVKISTISKQNETSFQLGLVISEYLWMRPKWFLSLWYIWHKSCTYLAPTLTPFPNGPKWHSTRPMSPWSFIGCVKNDFWAYGTFRTNCGPILCQD